MMSEQKEEAAALLTTAVTPASDTAQSPSSLPAQRGQPESSSGAAEGEEGKRQQAAERGQPESAAAAAAAAAAEGGGGGGSVEVSSEGGAVPGDGSEEAAWDVSAVGVKAQELGLNVVEMASSASHEAAAVVQNLSDTVSGFSTGFVSLFSVFSPAETEAAAAATHPSSSNAAAANQSEVQNSRLASREIDLQAIFGLPPEETLLESFSCCLLQSYRCTHNAFTPEMRKSFKGMLYLTDKHVCFFVDDFDRRIPIKLETGDIVGVSKHKPRKGEREDQLKLQLKSDRFIMFQEFSSVQDFESSLALLEHLLA